MAELHELLAVEGELEATARKVTQEAVVTFTKKTDHFTGHHKEVRAYDDNRQMEMNALTEHKDITTTVADKLAYIQESLIKFWNAKAQKDTTNQTARADVVVDGVVVLKQVPATFLLGMEKQLKTLRETYSTVPTQSPGTNWVLDPSIGDNIFKAERPSTKHKTEKTVQSRILVKPTKEHPAQIEKWSQDVPIADVITESWTGMITTAEKSKLLGKIDTLFQAFKQARQRANKAELIPVDVGKVIFDFIHE